jgi:hypothetical protein
MVGCENAQSHHTWIHQKTSYLLALHMQQISRYKSMLIPLVPTVLSFNFNCLQALSHPESHATAIRIDESVFWSFLSRLNSQPAVRKPFCFSQTEILKSFATQKSSPLTRETCHGQFLQTPCHDSQSPIEVPFSDGFPCVNRLS